MPVIFKTPTVLRAPQSETTSDVTLTSGTAAPGAFVEMSAQTTIQCNWLVVFVHNPNTANKYIVDIAVGPAGSEVNAITGILHHVNLTGMNIVTESSTFKVEIAKGVRLSARAEAAANTDTVEIKIVLQGIS